MRKDTVDDYPAIDIRGAARRRFRPGDALAYGRLRAEIEWVPCRFGGARPWLVCPGCGRRSAVLYVAGPLRCRRCLDLAYPTQQMGPRSRAIRRADKLRERLGGTAGIAWPFPPPPSGMHPRTYARLRAEGERLEARAWGFVDAHIEVRRRRLRRLLEQSGLKDVDA